MTEPLKSHVHCIAFTGTVTKIHPSPREKRREVDMLSHLYHILFLWAVTEDFQVSKERETDSSWWGNGKLLEHLVLGILFWPFLEKFGKLLEHLVLGILLWTVLEKFATFSKLLFKNSEVWKIRFNFIKLQRKENLKAFSSGSKEIGIVTLLQTTDFLRFCVSGDFILAIKGIVWP